MDKHVDLPALAAFTGVPHVTLRSWARRRNWTVVGRDADGRKLYDFPIVYAELQARERRLAA